MDTAICAICGNSFTATKDKKKFCSRECYYKAPRWNKGLKGSQEPWRRHDIYINCEYCNKEYKIVESRVGKSRFCSRACQNRWQAKNISIPKGEEHFNFKSGNTVAYYRREAFRIHGKICNRCGTLEKLIVHHIDENRQNNPSDGSNWEVLCRRCHQLHHDCISKLPKKEKIKEKLNIPKQYRLYTFTCTHCGKEYNPTHKYQKYCGRSCYHESNKKS